MTNEEFEKHFEDVDTLQDTGEVLEDVPQTGEDDLQGEDGEENYKSLYEEILADYEEREIFLQELQESNINELDVLKRIDTMFMTLLALLSLVLLFKSLWFMFTKIFFL